jgi:CheY-like chemotaxis protein
MTGRVPIVLLIEHDAIQRGTLARILKAAGYCVIPVGRTHEALETFSTHHVDIALVVANTQATTDGGPPLLDTLSAIDRRVPVVVLSAGVAGDRPAYEYPNVAATLIRPFEPADVLASVDRVWQSASQPSFNWPPTEEDLDDIEVVDTTEWQTPAAPAMAAAPQAQALAPLLPEPDAIPATISIVTAEPAAAPAIAAISNAPVTSELPDAPDELALRDVPDVPGMDIMRVEPAPPPRLVVRGSERRNWLMPSGRPSARTRRTLTVAATACFGLALTTLLELRNVPARHSPLLDETTPEVASLAPLSASPHRIRAMTLVSARRVRPRRIADVIRQRYAIRHAAPHTLASIETNTAAARTLPPAPVARPRPSPTTLSPVEVASASAKAIATTAARNTVTAANVPAAVTRAGTLLSPDTPDAVSSASDVPATPAAPAVARSGADERDIYQVLQRYERAYERLDVDAARAVWPSLNARALARAFDGLKAQTLELSHCRVAMKLSEATAVCGGSASYVPRVGRQSARTEPREWTFRLRKVDHDWLIAKAEVR